MKRPILFSLLAMSANVFAEQQSTSVLEESALNARIEQLENTNCALMHALIKEGALSSDALAQQSHCPPLSEATPPPKIENKQTIGLNPYYSFKMLDHAQGVNLRLINQLEAIQKGEIKHALTIGGSLTALADYQKSSSDSKFGWLMRHPTSNNQIGEEASEMVIHSAHIATTARLTQSLTSYVELLYDPEQSFGAGPITDLNRNQLQVRKAYVLWGDFSQSPFYAAIGKMDVPFGLSDTVSPFTNSSNWHAFAPLAYGGQIGYHGDIAKARLMAIQGGSQFRSANTSVGKTNVPSRLNNGAVDFQLTPQFGDNLFTLGGSYILGSAYCQDYPVTHFNICQKSNPAWAAYSQLRTPHTEWIAEFASTKNEWPGTHVPIPTNPLSVYEAQKADATTLGGRYWIRDQQNKGLSFSLEFSQFRAGDKGAPWERQDQWVAGMCYFPASQVKLFAEAVHVKGWVPLNFLSGGNLPDGSSWSERDATTDIIALGVQTTF